MITWIALKLAGLIGNVWMARINAIIDAVLSVISFLFKHWRVTAPLAIVSIGLIYINSLRSDIASANKHKAVAEKALIDHVESDNQAAKKREAENKLNAILAQKKTDADLAKHKAELSKIIAKGKKDEAITNRAISNYRDGLRLAIERQESAEAARLLEDDANQFASGNCNTALPEQLQKTKEQLATCKEAGAVCASDYNLCYRYVKTQQSILGVQDATQ